jgi:hypothetical protein
MAKYQCVQFGVCSRADKAECFEINGDFKCGREPEDVECQSKLEPVSGSGNSGAGTKISIAAVAVMILGGLGFWMYSSMRASPQEPVSTEQVLREIWPWLP